MKEIIGLLVFICISVITIYLAVIKKIDLKLTSIFLLFSILAGFAIANYDIIKRLKWGNFELETAKKEFLDFKNSAIQDFTREVKTQKESLELVIRDANTMANNIEIQKNDISKLVKTAELLQDELGKRKEEILSIASDTEKSKKEIKNLNETAQQITLALTKATYLSLKTRNEFGGPRVKKAIQEIEKDLNTLLPMVIPDPEKRKIWINDLEKTLSPKE